MTYRYTCSALCLLGLLLLTAPDAIAQQRFGEAPSLFQDANASRQALKTQGFKRLQTIEAIPTTASIRLVRLTDNLLQQTVLAMDYAADESLAPEIAVVFRNEKAKRGEGSEKVKLFIRRDDIDVINDSTYAWNGTIVWGPGNEAEVGEAHFIYLRGGSTSGSIRIKDEAYKVLPLENGLHALVEIDESRMPRGGSNPLHSGGGPVAASSAPEAQSHAAVAPEPEASLQNTCSATDDLSAMGAGGLEARAAAQASAAATTNCGGPAKIDLLMVYTAGAAQGRNINNLIATVVQETNRSYNNSAIGNLDLRLVHSQQVGFDPGDRLPDDDIDRLKNDPQIQSLRNQYDADVVILLTEDVYFDPETFGNITGAVDEILAEAPEAYGVVEAVWADMPAYTFAHEVGHVQGGQHHPNDINFNDPGYNPEGDYLPNSFGHRFSDRDCNPWPLCDRDYYATVMAYPFDRDRTFMNIEHFSNPDERFDSQRTGTNARNNASALIATASTIAGFRQAPQELVAFINVAGGIGTSWYTFSSTLCGGIGSYSYEWRISYNEPDEYEGVVSRQPSFSRSLPNGTHFVKLTVRTSSGQVVTTVRSVYVSSQYGSDGPLANAEAASAAKLPETFALHAPYPNPFNAASEIAFDLPERAEVRLAVYDVLGREVALLVSEARPAGVHRARFDAAGLTSGVYVVRFTAGSYAKTQRVVLVK